MIINDLHLLADEIIAGKRLSRNDDNSIFLTADLSSLCREANRIREALCSDKIDLCSITNGRGGSCSENCKFCAQSAHNDTGCAKYDYIDYETAKAGCEAAYLNGIDRYSVVTAGRTLDGKDLEKALNIYSRLHEEYPDMILCGSHGLMTKENLVKLREAGVTMYHENIETSKNYFPNICTTHTYEDKLTVINYAKEAGLTVCCGGIIGMGESWEDRFEMAISLSEMNVFSIPINALMPVKGTPLGNLTPISEDEILRTIAIFRFYNPDSFIRMAAGRSYFKDGGRDIFLAGANATITGDMLTTVGNNTSKDREMLEDLGFKLNSVKS